MRRHAPDPPLPPPHPSPARLHRKGGRDAADDKLQGGQHVGTQREALAVLLAQLAQGPVDDARGQVHSMRNQCKSCCQACNRRQVGKQSSRQGCASPAAALTTGCWRCPGCQR